MLIWMTVRADEVRGADMFRGGSYILDCASAPDAEGDVTFPVQVWDGHKSWNRVMVTEPASEPLTVLRHIGARSWLAA